MVIKSLKVKLLWVKDGQL